MNDRQQLSQFLRARREAIQPEDVGMTRGPRRRTSGLRREEVAALSGISSDYYSKIEQHDGPVPSQQILASIARGIQLNLDERDHLFSLAGYTAPSRAVRNDHVNAGLMRVLNRLEDTPAQVVTILGETLVQTRLAVALLGDETSYTGIRRNRIYRWFTDPDERALTPVADHHRHSATLVGHLVAASTSTSLVEPARVLIARLREESPEFAALWESQPVPGPYCEAKRIMHPEIGEVELYGQTILDPDQFQALMIFTAEPGSVSAEKLQLLSVIGAQRI